MRPALLLFAIVALLAAGCGGGAHTAATTALSTVSPPAVTAPPTQKTMPLELFFLADDGKLVGVRRDVPETQAVATAALRELAAAPAGATTDVPGGLTVSIADGVAHLAGQTLTKAALAQVVYTLTEFSTVKTVDGEGRADVEQLAPAILVEHPVPHESVTSPLRATGTADTYEATFQYELKDAGGAVIAHGFTTATSGNGMRGTFDFTVPFQIDRNQSGTLVVYESSAENGSRIHERAIPIELAH